MGRLALFSIAIVLTATVSASASVQNSQAAVEQGLPSASTAKLDLPHVSAVDQRCEKHFFAMSRVYCQLSTPDPRIFVAEPLRSTFRTAMIANGARFEPRADVPVPENVSEHVIFQLLDVVVGDVGRLAVLAIEPLGASCDPTLAGVIAWQITIALLCSYWERNRTRPALIRWKGQRQVHAPLVVKHARKRNRDVNHAVPQAAAAAPPRVPQAAAAAPPRAPPKPVVNGPIVDRPNEWQPRPEQGLLPSLVSVKGVEEDMCCVCWDAPRSALLVHVDGSGHFICCGACAEKVMAQFQRCPMCVKTVTRVIRTRK